MHSQLASQYYSKNKIQVEKHVSGMLREEQMADGCKWETADIQSNKLSGQGSFRTLGK